MPLNYILRYGTKNYKFTKINHLMYIEDIKLFATYKNKIETQMQAKKNIWLHFT